MKGIVVKSTGSWITVRTGDGIRIECKLKGQFRIKGLRSTSPIAIGDKVEFDKAPGEEVGLITFIEERNNYIIRKAIKLSSVTHIIGANIDNACLIVTLASPRTSTGFIDRFLVTATGYYIKATIIFNKIDLYNHTLRKREEFLRSVYEPAGYDCYSVSALMGTYVSEILTILAGKINLFAGHSGAGKSALINALCPELSLKTGKLSKVHGKGMHTTTFPEMFELGNGGFLIDTPGIKEFGLVDFEKSEIPRCFPEMERYLPHCQYRNCTHVHEPNCAVKEAVKSGGVSDLRYNSYLSILSDPD